MKGLVLAVLATFVFASNALAHGGGGGGGHGGGLIFIYAGGGGQMSVPDSTVGNYANIHKIGVLSAIGSNLDVLWHGSQSVRHDVSAWQIDERVRATLKKYLSEKYEVSDLPFNGQAVAAVTKQWYRERDTLKLLGTFTNPGVDAYMIVRPADGALPVSAGLGIDIAKSDDVELWANFEIDIIDAHSLAYLGKGYAQLQIQEGVPPAFAAHQLPMSPGSVLIGFGPALANPAVARVRKELDDLLPNAIVGTLRSLKMGVALPAIGDHSIATPANAGAMSRFHSMGVVSVIGQSFELINPGNLFVKRTDADVPVADAGIDDAVETVARNVLAKHFVVKPVSVDRSAVVRTTVMPGLPLPSFLGLTKTSDVDAYVLIVKAMRPEPPYRGLGLIHITPVFNHVTSAFANYAIVVVDARTLTSVAGTTGAEPVMQPCRKSDFAPTGQAPPMLECSVDENLWPPSGNTLAADGVTGIKSVVLKLLSGSIPETLFHLGLDQPDAAPASASASAAAGSIKPTNEGK